MKVYDPLGVCDWVPKLETVRIERVRIGREGIIPRLLNLLVVQQRTYTRPRHNRQHRYTSGSSNIVCVKYHPRSLLSEKNIEERERLVIAPSLPGFPYEKGQGNYLSQMSIRYFGTRGYVYLNDSG